MNTTSPNTSSTTIEIFNSPQLITLTNDGKIYLANIKKLPQMTLTNIPLKDLCLLPLHSDSKGGDYINANWLHACMRSKDIDDRLNNYYKQDWLFATFPVSIAIDTTTHTSADIWIKRFINKNAGLLRDLYILKTELIDKYDICFYTDGSLQQTRINNSDIITYSFGTSVIVEQLDTISDDLAKKLSIKAYLTR